MGKAAIKYVVITPVRDEGAHIEKAIQSMVSQTILPAEWIIVNDGSTDRTAEIASLAVTRNSWIRLFSLPARKDRSFAAVVHAVKAGVNALTVSDYQYIGLLDADVRFSSDYFEKVIERFESCPYLGLGGGMVVDIGQSKNRLPRNRQDVPGASQFFRRRCFDELGDLFAIPEGGWDALTCVRARMLGYETRLFTDLVVDHLKSRNIAHGSALSRKWQMGVRDYALGYHPVFELFKSFSRLKEPPVVLGSIAWISGYCSAGIVRRPRLIPEDLLRFIRSEQLERLKRFFWGEEGKQDEARL